MKEHSILKLHRSRLAPIALLGMLASVLSGCDGDGGQEFRGINVRGETVVVDPERVCWDASEPIPEGYEAQGDVASDSFVFVPKAGIGFRAAAGGTCSCTCDKAVAGEKAGDCSPLVNQGVCYCVMGAKCATCSKTTTPAGGGAQ